MSQTAKALPTGAAMTAVHPHNVSDRERATSSAPLHSSALDQCAWKRVGTGRREAVRNPTKRTITKVNNAVCRYTCFTDTQVAFPKLDIISLTSIMFVWNGGSALKNVSFFFKVHWTQNHIYLVLNMVICLIYNHQHINLCHFINVTKIWVSDL